MVLVAARVNLGYDAMTRGRIAAASVIVAGEALPGHRPDPRWP
jgi:hypothetical protein